MDELARFIRRARRAVLAQNENLGVGDGLADRVRAPVDFARR